ncbi:MAG: hypothetical protein Q9192_008691 [Flavoplaca navasiana]
MSTLDKAPLLKTAELETGRKFQLEGVLARINGNYKRAIKEHLQAIRNDAKTHNLYTRTQELGTMIVTEVQKASKDRSKLDPLIQEFLQKDGAMMSRLYGLKHIDLSTVEQGPSTQQPQGPISYTSHGNGKKPQ